MRKTLRNRAITETMNMHMMHRPSYGHGLHAKARERVAIAFVIAMSMMLTTAGCAGRSASSSDTGASRSPVASQNATTSQSPSGTGSAKAYKSGGGSADRTDSAEYLAGRLVSGMSVAEKVGQLMMVPLFSGNDPGTIREAIVRDHVGSVLLIGNWSNGVSATAGATATLQGYAPENRRLLICTDQEGGQVQHLSGEGFNRIPSAVEQGRVSGTTLRRSAKTWGGQLAQAGVNVDLAPVADTVTTPSRADNAPIGALNRDFGLNPAGNGDHAAAFVAGMRDAGIMTAVKHFPGLGGVTGNTDFTAKGIVDSSTTLRGGSDDPIEGFRHAIAAKPDMVMMSLAVYAAIDGSSPAAFSSRIVNGYLRKTLGYEGVVTSDSMSAEALGSIPVRELGVRFVSAGGDLICIGDESDVAPILQGLLERARSDAGFARQVDRAATRVMTLKIRAGLA